MSRERLIAIRDRLNVMGEASGYYHGDDGIPADTYPHRNASAWNRKRIRIRNKINARLRTIGA